MNTLLIPIALAVLPAKKHCSLLILITLALLVVITLALSVANTLAYLSGAQTILNFPAFPMANSLDLTS